ncbi:MAG: SGNH/GDSL hydrolase family protein [Gemmatimonadota bacterium]
MNARAGGRAELRLAWILLGLVLAAGARDPALADPPGLALLAVPWLAGAVLVVAPARADRICAHGARLVAVPGVRIAALLGTALWLLAFRLFGAAGGLVLLAWGGAALLALCAVSTVERTAGLLQGAAAAGATIALAIAAGEVGLRHSGANARLGLPAERAERDARYDLTARHNFLGFRTPHETFAKPAGVQRVVTLGDSFTWGFYIPRTEDTWPARLESRLNAARQTPVEVVNLGRPRYTTANEAEVLRRIGWQFSPDVVVLQFLVNDGLPSGDNFKQVDARWLFPTRALVPGRFRTAALESSALLAFLEKQVRFVLNGRESYREYLRLYDDGTETWAQVSGALEEMASAAREREVPVVVLLFPHLLPGAWTPESYPLRPAYDRVAARARGLGLLVIDLTDIFASMGGDWQRWWATPYDAHPNEAALDVVSAVVADTIVARGWMGEVRTAAGSASGSPALRPPAP